MQGTVFRVDKNKNYTTMGNYHLRDIHLSLKAKGLLSVILSLPEEWDYSINGLVSISMEGAVAVKSALKELKDNGYLEINQSRSSLGQISYEYIIHEKPLELEDLPSTENPPTVNPTTDNLKTDNHIQLNTKELNTKESSKENKRDKPKFIPPTKDEIRAYCQEKNYVDLNVENFYNYYDALDWHLSNGKKMKNWKASIATWVGNSYQTKRNEKPLIGIDGIPIRPLRPTDGLF